MLLQLEFFLVSQVVYSSQKFLRGAESSENVMVPSIGG